VSRPRSRSACCSRSRCGYGRMNGCLSDCRGCGPRRFRPLWLCASACAPSGLCALGHPPTARWLLPQPSPSSVRRRCRWFFSVLLSFRGLRRRLVRIETGGAATLSESAHLPSSRIAVAVLEKKSSVCGSRVLLQQDSLRGSLYALWFVRLQMGKKVPHHKQSSASWRQPVPSTK